MILAKNENIPLLIRERDTPHLLLQKAPFPISESTMQSEFSSTFLERLRKQAYFPARLYKKFFLKHAYRFSETEL